MHSTPDSMGRLHTRCSDTELSTSIKYMFDAHIITNDLDHVYQESVKPIIAIAIWLSQPVDRDINITLSPTELIALP